MKRRLLLILLLVSVVGCATPIEDTTPEDHVIEELEETVVQKEVPTPIEGVEEPEELLVEEKPIVEEEETVDPSLIAHWTDS